MVVTAAELDACPEKKLYPLAEMTSLSLNRISGSWIGLIRCTTSLTISVDNRVNAKINSIVPKTTNLFLPEKFLAIPYKIAM